MSRLKIFPLVILISFLISCGDDDDPTNPLIGTWQLDIVALANVPAAYDYWNGDEFLSFYGENGQTLEITANSYTRSLDDFELITGGFQSISETGEWSTSENTLILDPTGAELPLSQEFEIVIQTGSDLVLSAPAAERLSLNIFQDTVTDAYFDYLDALLAAETKEDTTKWEDEVESFTDVVNLDYVYDFDQVIAN